jgi:hypothetical protein
VAQAIQGARHSAITKQAITTEQLFSNPIWELFPYIVIAVFVAFAVWYFKKSQGYFAENV